MDAGEDVRFWTLMTGSAVLVEKDSMRLETKWMSEGILFVHIIIGTFDRDEE